MWRKIQFEMFRLNLLALERNNIQSDNYSQIEIHEDFIWCEILYFNLHNI